MQNASGENIPNRLPGSLPKYTILHSTLAQDNLSDILKSMHISIIS